MSRSCPKCAVPFQVTRHTFAEIDTCPQCGGAFFDPGEGASTHGAASEASFLVRDGRARIVRVSPFTCPNPAHEPTGMQVYAVGFGESAIEIDYCVRCGGFFLDRGEGAALAALEARPELLETASGARFSAPPAVDRHSRAIEQARAQNDKSFFELFVLDVIEAVGQAARTLGDGSRPRRRSWRRR